MVTYMAGAKRWEHGTIGARAAASIHHEWRLVTLTCSHTHSTTRNVNGKPQRVNVVTWVDFRDHAARLASGRPFDAQRKS
jgi:hypothetical protein